MRAFVLNPNGGICVVSIEETILNSKCQIVLGNQALVDAQTVSIVNTILVGIFLCKCTSQV